MPNKKKKQGKGIERSPKESVPFCDTESVRATPFSAKPEQVSTEHLLASLKGVIKSIKKTDSVDRDVISALLMDLQVSERDGKGHKVSEGDCVDLLVSEGDGVDPIGSERVMDDNEVQLDFDDDSMLGDLEPEEEPGVQGEQNPSAIEEELCSEIRSPEPKKTRRLVEEEKKSVMDRLGQKRPKAQPQDEEVKCFKCLETGHYKKDCTKEQACHKCKKTGHLSSECPEKKAIKDQKALPWKDGKDKVKDE